MTAATDTLPYDASLITEAQETYQRAMRLPWPEDADKAIGEAVLDLSLAMGHYSHLLNGDVPRWYAGQTPGPQGYAKALKYAAENAAERAGVLADLLPGCADETTSGPGGLANEGEK